MTKSDLIFLGLMLMLIALFLNAPAEDFVLAFFAVSIGYALKAFGSMVLRFRRRTAI